MGDTHATVHKKLKLTHPDTFRKDGLELRGFSASRLLQKVLKLSAGAAATVDGFYCRSPRDEQPPQNIRCQRDIWDKKDKSDWHFVVRSTTLFPFSDGNWGFIQLDRQTNELIVSRGFVSQQDAINPLSLGVHPPRTTLVLTYHDIYVNESRAHLAVSEDIIIT